ncbi:hypothetical protein Gohar_010142 [Gossypium harknessii]|uniref:RNase H type-1 domain-containing protein n=1 Tax=Gossypium harknessii TaxID=34285 RepID=A0A7J9GQN4_9ROSI|nr:hypothetical protein [Gossypium harknessii]
MCSFAMRIGKDSVFKTEVRAILEGLNLAWGFGFRQLELECDNALVVGIILVGGAGNELEGSLEASSDVVDRVTQFTILRKIHA